MNNLDMPENTNYCLGDNIGGVALIQYCGDDAGIVDAARVSFGKRSTALTQYARNPFNFINDNDHETHYDVLPVNSPEAEKDKKLIRYLLQHEHGTPFEHNLLTFLVKCPLFVARQWMRHRIGVSYNEISGRYVEMKDEFYIPKGFRKQSENNRQASINECLPNSFELNHEMKHHFIQCFNYYENLLKAGVSREQARSVLPVATYTQFYFSCNLRSLLHFIQLRDHEGAQWETRQFAKALKELAKPIFPVTFQIWEELNS